MSFNINMSGLGGNTNSIADFNKIFQQNLDMVNKNIETGDSFQNIFDNVQNMQKSANPKHLQGGIEHFTGIDAISAQKVENLSDTAKMARDLGNGFKGSINSLNSQQKAAEQAFETFATGGDISVHELMIASQKSSLSMQMALQLRNQMVNAYTQLRDIRL